MGKNDKDIAKLVDDLLSRLSGEEQEKLRQRLGDDPSLAELTALVGEQAEMAETGDWGKLQIAAHRLLDSMLKDVHTADKNHQQHGVLTFDSGLLPAPEGVRPAAVDTRRLRYQIGERLLELSLYPVSVNSFELIGQISDSPATLAMRVELVANRRKITATAEQFGIFRFPRVPSGEYRVRIISGDQVIATVDLEL